MQCVVSSLYDELKQWTFIAARYRNDFKIHNFKHIDKTVYLI